MVASRRSSLSSGFVMYGKIGASGMDSDGVVWPSSSRCARSFV